MGLFDWIGPTSLTKRRGWDALPVAIAERKSYPYIDDHRAVIISPLVHGPGAGETLSGRRGDGNSAVLACLRKIETAYVEAPIYAYRQVNPKEREPLFDSPLQQFLETANPAFDILEIMAWVQRAKRVDGNAYLRKLRAGNPDTGNVVELWPISPTRIEPKTTRGSGDFISYYRYYDRPGHHEDIATENIIHFRVGIDDRDHRLGCAPLKVLLREISSDDQATRYADRLLANLAINGLSLEFDKDTQAIDKPMADELKARIQAAYGGDNVGAVSVLSPGAKLVSHGFSPEQMTLDVLHRLPEERISAVLEVPAIVAGLGAGLQRSTFANFKEANEAFIEQNILPSFAADDRKLTRDLRPDFTSDRRTIIAHDISQMRALQDDENARAARLKIYVESEILTRDEARAEIGREPLPEQAALPAPVPSQEQRSRPRIVTLPLARKSLDDLPGLFGRLKDDAEPDWQDALDAFLIEQIQRVTRALRAGVDTAEGLLADGEATLLGEVLQPLQRSLLADVSRLVVAELGIAFDLDDAATRDYLTRAGANITGITSTTREAVRAALIEGQQAGEGIAQLADRLRQLSAFNRARAITIARTELGHASNTAALANYRASGVVVGVTVFDGDYDAECAAMNGRKFSLDQAPPTLQHPNCRRAFAPVVDSAELESPGGRGSGAA